MTSKRERQKLQADASYFDVRDRQTEVRRRAAAFVRSRYTQDAEKLLQRELDINESAAERILAGRASSNLLDRMHRAWGWAFSGFVLQPLSGPFTLTAVDHTIEVIEQHATAVLEWTTKLRAEARERLDADRGPVAAGSAGPRAGGAPTALESPQAEVAQQGKRRAVR